MIKYSQYLRPDRFVVFLLHGVLKKSDYRVRNYTRKHIEAAYFDDVIADLVQHGNAVSLDQYVDHLAGKFQLPESPFAITFDDGFENNHTVAAPILRKHQVPATFYVTSGFIEHNGMSWVDQIELCVEKFRPLSLTMPWRETPYELTDPASERVFLDDVRRFVKGDRNIIPSDIVELIYRQCDQPVIAASDDPLDRKMTWEQVAELASDGLFIVGGHTHTHAILGYQDSESMKREVDTPIDMLLEKARFSVVRHFSYPEGFDGSYNEETIQLLKARGVVCSPSAIEDINEFDADPFHLRRIFIV